MTNKPVEQNQEFRNRHMETLSLSCELKEKVDFLTNGAYIIGYPYRKKKRKLGLS